MREKVSEVMYGVTESRAMTNESNLKRNAYVIDALIDFRGSIAAG